MKLHNPLNLIALLLATLAGSAPALADIDKLGTYASMRALDGELQSLRGVAGEQQRRAQLQAEFDALKLAMGGDDPTTMREANNAAAAAAAQAVRAAPPAPPGLVVTTTTATNNTPLAIPTGPAVVSATLNIAGAGSYLWDVDLTTMLTHTFAADLDITIASPAGTVVTLSTDNGAGNDNVFNGTLWDDQATTPVSDNVFANLVTATPLVPEEAFGAFRGEDPNGTWTITISDDLAGDGGSLDAWTLDVFTLASAPIETTSAFSNNTPVPIADVAASSSTIVVSGAGTTLTSVDLLTAIQHTFAADMDITLTSPAGTIVTLGTDNGAGNDDVYNGTAWDDQANPGGQVPYTTNNGLVTDQLYANLVTATPLVPEGALSAFLGQDPNGTWTLTVTDDLAGDTGSINNWTLNVTTGVGNVPPVFAYSPAPTGTVGFVGGTSVGSLATGTITVSVATPGVGSGTTTTTCAAPSAPFSGFGQVVSAVGAGAVSGGPLSGGCTLGPALVTQTLICTEDQDGTPVTQTFELSCPAGTALLPAVAIPTLGSRSVLGLAALALLLGMLALGWQARRH
ncbi:MAG: proprotein convertase P-domain-containing protein [Lysobacterales bacterium]